MAILSDITSMYPYAWAGLATAEIPTLSVDESRPPSTTRADLCVHDAVEALILGWQARTRANSPLAGQGPPAPS